MSTHSNLSTSTRTVFGRWLDIIYISSSSCRAISKDISVPFSPPLPIVHCFRQVLWATTRIVYVRAGRPAFARPCRGVHRSSSLMSSSLLLQQCPACLARLIWIVFVMGGGWPYSCCFVGCCLQDLFNSRLFSVHVVHPYSSIDTITAWKKLRFILYNCIEYKYFLTTPSYNVPTHSPIINWKDTICFVWKSIKVINILSRVYKI